jgi:hypothetical protein
LKARGRSISFSDASIAVEWLNATNGTKAQQRVLDVRHELEELGATLDSLSQQRQEGRAARKGRRTPPSPDDMKDATQYAERYTLFRERHNALNLILSRYAFVPVLAWDLDTGIWRCSAVPRDVRGRTIQVSDGGMTVQVNEAAVVAALARLAANRKLHKVRLCEECRERWQVAERKVDRFCSAKCREAYYAHSPEYLPKKAEAQRRYREQKKRHGLM